MRDLKRANAKLPAYKQLLNEHFEVFTPMKEQLSVHGGKRTREEVPFIQDLLLFMIPRKLLIRLWKSIPRYSIVSRREVVTKSDDCRWCGHGAVHTCCKCVEKSEILSSWRIDTLYVRTAHPYCRRPLDGYEGKLLTVRGSKTKRLLVELPEFFSVGVEVNPEYIRLL